VKPFAKSSPNMVNSLLNPLLLLLMTILKTI
jgi:hypothetical protein